jgi:hypothetical protein
VAKINSFFARFFPPLTLKSRCGPKLYVTPLFIASIDHGEEEEAGTVTQQSTECLPHPSEQGGRREAASWCIG